MEKNYAPESFVDFFSSFEGGMQSGVAPLLLKKNQVGVGINCSIRGGFIRPRPAIQLIKLNYGGDSALKQIVEQGMFQGAAYYRPDFGTEFLVAQINGHLISFTENGSAWMVRDVSVPNDFNDPNVTQVWMWQSEKWLIINDGSGRLPIFFDGATSRRSFGPSQLWGTTAVDFIPPAIGDTVQLTLTSPYIGQFNVPVILNGEFYQPIQNPTIIYPAKLTNISDSSGQIQPAGSNVVIRPDLIAKAFSVNTTTNVGPHGVLYFVDFHMSTLLPDPIIPHTTQTFYITTPGGQQIALTYNDFQNFIAAGSAGEPAQIRVIKHGVPKTISDVTGPGQPYPSPIGTQTTSPSVVVGAVAEPFVVPAIGDDVTINLSAPYSGNVNQPVWINNEQYLISPAPAPTPSEILTVINLTDTDTSPVTAPAEILSVPELPAGRMGAYGMGRNWFSLTDGISYEAGDIVGGGSGTPANNYRDAVLKTTENDFLAGGGTFRLPGTGDIITAMLFPPILDTSLGQGALEIGTPFSMFSNNAPADRTEWAALTFPIQTESLKDKGPLAQNSTVLVNSDTFFRSYDGFGSLILARRDFVDNSWGNKSISNEMQRILKLDTQSLLPYGSAITFDNRFLATCAPNVGQQGVFHVGLASLNFDLLSSLRENLPASWEGAWTGINVLQLLSGRVNGAQRAFSFTFNVTDSKIELYELLSESTTQYKDNGATPIVWFFETPCAFDSSVKDATTLCQLRDGEVYLSNIKGEVDVQIFYKPDFYPCWTLWRELKVCSDLSATNANPAYRMRIGLGEPSPDPVEIGNNRPLRIGYFFQYRVVITGSCAFNGIRSRAVEFPTQVFAPIEQVEQACQALDCDVPNDLEVYSLQGLPPQPLPPEPVGTVFNQTVFFENVCSNGSPAFTGNLPNWISVDADNNRMVGAANTFLGVTQVAANETAQTALNNFTQTNLVNGNISCGSGCDGTDTSAYKISGYTDGMISNPSGGAPAMGTWDGTFNFIDNSVVCVWGGWTAGTIHMTIDGKGANCAKITFVDPSWLLQIWDSNNNLVWSGTKSSGAHAAGTYTNDNTGLDASPTTLSVVQNGTGSSAVTSTCEGD